ncbi:hypothetical protein DAEQUDRAFT_541958 [Daedalea quercina L-15889]|uniref:Uncharacterized protein n=1 Tax=Daedalea quercina L-15889 TaxID=1314783 RepID=A0A165M460_9APHY|nr:hypothetical protein DAEQUDRAFT_541958 [Daedalea quercina L-15889]
MRKLTTLKTPASFSLHASFANCTSLPASGVSIAADWPPDVEMSESAALESEESSDEREDLRPRRRLQQFHPWASPPTRGPSW